MLKEENIKLYKDDYNENCTITFREFYNQILDEIDNYKRLDRLDDLMDQKMSMQIVDLEGQILEGYMTSGLIGWLENGDVLISGNLRDIYFNK